MASTTSSSPTQAQKHHREEEIEDNEVTWADLILEKTVKDLVQQKDKELIVCQETLTLREALDVLQKNDILSAPVIDSGRQFCGIVDVLDIAGFTLDAWHQQSSSLVSVKKRDYTRDEFFHTQLKDLINFSGVDLSIFVLETDTIAHLIQKFCKPKRHARLHRVVVVNSSKHVVNIISQTDIIRFASIHADVFPNFKISEVELWHSPIMVRLDSPFYSALEILYQNRVSGIALVDEMGRISANLSASDLRGITQKSFSYFNGSVLQFLTKGTKSQLSAPITCGPDATISDVVKLMVHKQVHRVYLLHENYPVSVITMTELIQFFNVEKKKHKKAKN